MVAGFATVDFRVDGEPSGSPGLPKPFLGGTLSVYRIVTGRVDVRIAAAAECIQKGLNIFCTIEVRDARGFGTITNLSCSD